MKHHFFCFGFIFQKKSGNTKNGGFTNARFMLRQLLR